MSHLLGAWVDGMRRGALWVVAGALALAALAASYTVENLGIDTDTGSMFSDDLPWRRTYLDLADTFTQFSNLIVVVVDAQTPDLAERAARRLAERLAAESALVEWVYRPGAGAFFERNAMLYLDEEALEALAEDLTEMQPFLGRLSADPSLRGLFALATDALTEGAGSVTIDLAPVFARLSQAIEATLDGRFHELSWRELMAPSTVDTAASERRRIVQVKARLDYSELLPAGPAMERIRELARELELDPEHGVRVRLTGSVPLQHEELESVSRGMEIAAIGTFVMVAVVLLVGLQSVRLVLACLVTLVVGLLWTAAFAALAIGSLNLISVAFAVLYIGLGIDNAIHFAMRYQELMRQGRTHTVALRTAAGDVGGSLALCTATTGVAFLAFVPTEFAGVSELGLIAGVGMFISLLASLTVLPALLTLAPLRQGGGGDPNDSVRARGMGRYRRVVLTLATLLAIGSLTTLPRLGFDRNPLNMRDAESESVAAFRDILADSETSPWPLVVLVDGETEARAMRDRLEKLESVDSVLGVDDFVPRDQEARLFVIEDLAMVLSLDPDAGVHVPRPGFEAQRQAVDTLRSALGAEPRVQGAQRLERALARLASALAGADGPEIAASVERSLLGGLEDQLRQLRTSLEAGPFALADLPQSLRGRWVAGDGRLRLEIYPARDIQDHANLEHFVSQVHGVAAGATDTPVTMLESGDSVVRAFRQAFATALALIAVLLLVLLRRPADVAMVLGPLALAGLLTMAVMVVLGLQFNFANVITLPLLLGIGVDNGIHMVHRARSAPPARGGMFATSTTRAVVTSALTTICGFGNLAWSGHPGTASMGMVLTIGLGLTLLCTLVVLPALLDERPVA